MLAEMAQNFFTTGKIQSLELLQKENEFLNDSVRIALQEKSYYYYTGDITEVTEYLKIQVRKVLGDEVVRDNEWIYDILNITKKIINLSSIVYKEPAVRYFTDDKGNEKEDWTEYYEQILPDNINSKNKTAHRFAKLFNTSLTQVTFDKEKGKVNLQIEPSCNYKIKTEDYDYLKAVKIGYQKEFTNPKGEKEVYLVVWTDTEHYMVDSKGKKTPIGDNEDKKNPFGILPFPILRLNEDDNFWGAGSEDVVNVNEVVNFLLTFLLNDGVVLGSGGIPLFINTFLQKQAEKKNEVKKVRVSRRHPIVIDDAHTTDLAPPSVSFVRTDADIAGIQNTIDYRIKSIAVMKGLNPNTILSQVKDTSDYQKMMDSLEQIEIRRDDIEPCREYERQMFEIVKVVNNVAYEDAELRNKFKLKQIPDDIYLVVDFADIKQEMTPEQLWADRKERESRNMGSAVDWLIEENPGLTEDEAKKILEDNKKINQSIGGQSVPSLFEQLNINEEQVNE